MVIFEPVVLGSSTGSAFDPSRRSNIYLKYMKVSVRVIEKALRLEVVNVINVFQWFPVPSLLLKQFLVQFE